MVKNFDIIDGHIIEKESGPIILFTAPTAEEKTYLTENCQIDTHTLNSALDPEEISSIEFEDDYTAIIIKKPKNYNVNELSGFGVTSVGLFIFNNRVIIVQSEDVPLFEYGRIPIKVKSIKGVVLRILHHATNHFLEHIKIVRMISERIEKDIEFSISNHHLNEMFVLSKSLTYYESATGANKLLLAKMQRDSSRLGFDEKEVEFLEDIIIENNQCVRMIEVYASILVGMSDARGSIVGNNLAVLMKQLAIINIIFLPLNVIVGLGGMSEFTMMTESVWWGHSYSLMTLMLILLAYVTYHYLRKVNLSNTEEDEVNF